MSYGYLIITSNPTTWLEKERRYNFFLCELSEGLYFYSRLEGWFDGLTIRNQEQSILSEEGVKYLSRIALPFYFVDFLLTRRQGEKDLINIYKKNIKLKRFETIKLVNQQVLKINHLYRFIL